MPVSLVVGAGGIQCCFPDEIVSIDAEATESNPRLGLAGTAAGIIASNSPMPLSAGARLGCYEILSTLGAGGMGEVYRARDTKLERDVAVKVIHPDAAGDPTAVSRFTREAQAASALNHPNIVSVFDFGECDAGPYIVMEMIEGRTLRTILRTTPGIETWADIGRQVARALGVAHAAGIVHRDIKPENVMVRGDGYVKVLDFGLARASRADADSEASTTIQAGGASITGPGGFVIGTVAYMSPEQARGLAVDCASDIFALGLVFYELATGRHPFAAAGQTGDNVSIVARMIAENPLPPSRFAPQLSAAIDALILQMLDRDPRARPDADAVDRALAEAFGGATAAIRRPSPLPIRHTVGRDDARTILAGAFDAADAGVGTIVTLSGEPGIGKTTLAEDFLQDLVTSGRRRLVARGRCSERQAGAGAYLPWLEALDSIRDETGQPLARVMKTVAPTWYAQIAPMAADDSPEARALVVNRAGSQEWMKRELVALLEEVSRHRPLVLFFDDLHWADGSTVDLLAYLGTRLGAMRLLVVATYRPTDLMRDRHPFLALKLELEGRHLCRDVHVGFLSEADVERYLALEFPGHQLPASFAKRVHGRTEGNPLFMGDLLRSLRDRQVIREENGAWRLTRPESEVDREMPASIRSMIELKIGRLDDSDRRLMTVAAVQGSEFDSVVVARALSLDQADVEDRLDLLTRQHGLVQQVREMELPDRSLSVKCRFVHALYQNALYSALGPSRRASLSAAVAAAIVAVHGDQVSARAAELAYLFEGARDFSRAAEFFLIASERARQVFADREALALARRGMEMLHALPAAPERVPRELQHLMAIALPAQNVLGYAAPELEETFRRVHVLCDQLGENPDLFGIVTGTGAFHLMRAELGRTGESVGQMQSISERVGHPVMSIWAEWSYGTLHGHLGRGLADALRHLDHGTRLYDPALHAGFMIMTGFDAGLGCGFQGARVEWMLGRPDSALARIGATVARARELNHPLMLAFALFFEAWIRQHGRDPQGVLAVTDEILTLVEQYGYPHLGAWSRILHGWALAQTGDAGAGEAMIRQSIDFTDVIGISLVRPNFLALLADAQAMQGHFDEALTTLHDAQNVAERTDECCYLAEILRLTADVRMRKGKLSSRDADATDQLLTRAVLLAREQGARGFELRAATTRAVFAAREGGASVAAEELAALVDTCTEGFDTPDFLDAKLQIAV